MGAEADAALPATDRRPVVGRGEVGGGAVHGCGLCVCVARSEEEARASCQVCLQDGARETVADFNGTVAFVDHNTTAR